MGVDKIGTSTKKVKLEGPTIIGIRIWLDTNLESLTSGLLAKEALLALVGGFESLSFSFE